MNWEHFPYIATLSVLLSLAGAVCACATPAVAVGPAPVAGRCGSAGHFYRRVLALARTAAHAHHGRDTPLVFALCDDGGAFRLPAVELPVAVVVHHRAVGRVLYHQRGEARDTRCYARTGIAECLLHTACGRLHVCLRSAGLRLSAGCGRSCAGQVWLFGVDRQSGVHCHRAAFSRYALGCLVGQGGLGRFLGLGS